MDINTLQKYIGYKVFLTLKNGFKYKIFLKEEYIIGDKISFIGKFGEPIDFTIDEISFITIVKEDRNDTNK